MSTKVLIIDDEPDVAKYLAMILQSNGYEPIVAHSAEDGWQIVDSTRPALICLDIMMPRESGIAMYRKLRESDSTSSIPVIFVSGAEQEEKFDFRAYLPDESTPEPDGYLEKPIDIDKYLKIVDRLTDTDSSKRGETGL